MDRQKGLVEYIYKLINSNFRYRKYKIHDKSFVVHFVYNLFYSMFKASYPRDRIQPIASKFHFNLVIAFYLFNKVEHSKTLVDHVIADIFKLKNHY